MRKPIYQTPARKRKEQKIQNVKSEYKQLIKDGSAVTEVLNHLSEKYEISLTCVRNYINR